MRSDFFADPKTVTLPLQFSVSSVSSVPLW